MYTRSFDTDGQLKTHPIGSDIRTLTCDAASRITQNNGVRYRITNFDYKTKNVFIDILNSRPVPMLLKYTLKVCRLVRQ